MVSQILLLFLLSTCFSRVANTAAPPVNLALDQPLQPLDTGAFKPPTLQDPALLNNSISFKVPGTQISLVFSKFSELVSQSELDLCVIEGMASVFGSVLTKKKDAPLPLNAVEYKYGNVVINVHDYSPPSFRMTYASVLHTLRGLALFTSMFGYWSTSFEVYDFRSGHVGTGDFGLIIPLENPHGSG